MKTRGIITIAVLLSAASVQASNWGLASGNWTDDAVAGWGGTEPTSSDIANVYAGTVQITTGNAEVCNELRLGNTSANTGTLDMSGGSLTHGNANVGLNGVSTVNITGGSIQSSGSVAIGGGATATGTVTVAGSGASWNSASILYLGNSGSGTLAISGGGSFNNISAYIGRSAGSDGSLTVTGSGSTWTSSSGVQVGASGTGELTVSFGAVVSSAGTSFLGANAGGSGTATVSGAGSIWKQVGSLRVGWNGTGALTIDDDGSVVVDSLSVDSSSVGGYVNMGIDGSLSLLDAADSGSADITAFLGLVGGTDDINYWDGSAWADITAGTEGVDYTLSHSTSGDLADYTTLTIIPEPGTMGLFVIASAGLLAVRRMRI